jgi:hypothetical protein
LSAVRFRSEISVKALSKHKASHLTVALVGESARKSHSIFSTGTSDVFASIATVSPDLLGKKWSDQQLLLEVETWGRTSREILFGTVGEVKEYVALLLQFIAAPLHCEGSRD